MAKEACILVVDGEPRICEFLEFLLIRYGHQTHSAHHAAEAFAQVEAGAYDLAPADVAKPFDIDELRKVVSRALQPVPAV